MHATIWLSIFYLLSAGQISAQVSAKLDSTRLETGHPMTLHLTAIGSKPEGVDFSAWDSLVPADNRLRQSVWELREGRWVKDMTFTIFDSAQLILPALKVKLANGANTETNPLVLTVYPTQVPNNQLLDIKDIRREKAEWLDYWPLFAALAGLILLAVLAWWFLRKPKPQPEIVSRTIQLSPAELALKKLDVLEQQQFWLHGPAQLKVHYSELTHIAREFLENTFRVPALESTSDELLAALARTNFPAEHAPALRDILNWADLAKFAKGEPPADFHAAAIEKIRRLVLAAAPPISA